MICVCSFSLQLLGAEEGDFTDKIIDSDFPEDWEVDDIHEEFDENGWNLLHYSVLKGFSNAVQVLVEDLDFGKSQFYFCMLLCS